VTAATAPPAGASTAANVLPPEGIHPDAGANPAGALPVPPSSTKAQVVLGEAVFHGQDGGTCAGCHGSDAKGTPLGPDLTSGTWLWGNGSLAALRKTIANGVPSPKKYQGQMPPLGGAELTTADVSAVTAYVWAVGHQSGQ
jgi:mono/diheme cytochrome c family protein